MTDAQLHEIVTYLVELHQDNTLLLDMFTGVSMGLGFLAGLVFVLALSWLVFRR